MDQTEEAHRHAPARAQQCIPGLSSTSSRLVSKLRWLETAPRPPRSVSLGEGLLQCKPLLLTASLESMYLRCLYQCGPHEVRPRLARPWVDGNVAAGPRSE